MNHVFLVVLAAGAVWGGAALVRHNAAHAARKAASLAGVALIWAILRATVFSGVTWTFVRPLGGGWIALFVVLLVAVVAAAVFLPSLATPLAWLSLVLAVGLPFTDIFTEKFWGDWMHENMATKIAMLVALLFLTAVTTGLLRLMAGALAALLVIGWALSASGLMSLFAPDPAPPTPTASASASPSPTPSSVTTPTPTPTPTPIDNVTHVTLSKDGDKIVGWDDVLALLRAKAATSGWQSLINDNKGRSGFDWDDVQQWASTTVGGKSAGARLVVVFGVDKAQLSDQAARETVGLVGNDEKDVPVVRASEACYQNVVLGQRICPADGNRAILTLAPIDKKDGKLSLRRGTGVALIPNPGKAEELLLTLVTYE